MNKVDLAREDRVRRADKLIEEWMWVLNHEKLPKIIEKKKEDVSDLCLKLKNELCNFASRINQ